MNSFCLFIVTVSLLKNLKAQDVIIVEAVVGSTADLPCNVVAEKKDDKLNILAWYRNGSTTAFYSRDLRGEGSVMSSNKRYRLVSSQSEGTDKLQVINVRPSDAGIYLCHADFAGSPTVKTYSQLIVIEPPQKMWVIHENGTKIAVANIGSNTSKNIGPYYIGDTIYLMCVAYEGKPKPSLAWRTEQRLLKDTNTPLSEQRVRSDLIFGPLGREDHGRVLTCDAKNNEKTQKLAIDIIIDMYLPPELVSVRPVGNLTTSMTVGRVRTGEPLALQCRVIGARPLPSVVWRLDDSQLVNLEQNVTIDSSQRLVVSDIQLVVSHEFDESQVTCCAPAHRSRAEQFICAASLPLTVLYPPELKIVADREVENNTLTIMKGSNVSLNCSYQANPSIYELIWFHEEDPVSDNQVQSEASAFVPTLMLTNVSETDAGEYVCKATNNEGPNYSDPLIIDVTSPPFCEDETVSEYGVGDEGCVNLTCRVKGNPEPSTYYWLVVTADGKLRPNIANNSITLETQEPTLQYKRPNGTSSFIYCWGVNGVVSKELQESRCTFMITDETAPRAPCNCFAIKNILNEITVTCDAGHNGGMEQNFKFIVIALDSEDQIVSIIKKEPKFMIEEPKQEDYKFVILAFNDKGESKSVEITKEDIISESEEETISAVTNITTLALALCGGVALLALTACGLVLCAHERSSRDIPHTMDPPLCAYNTDESNCETFHDSDDGSECNVRRTESFRRAMAKYPSKNYDVQRTSSFHSARYAHDRDRDPSKCNDMIRHSAACKVHSLQNINRKREMDVLCDHLVMHLPPETNYNVPKPMNTFYTMPRKMRHKAAKEISDETSEITQNSDGFSLPPPPDEFGSYRAATRIRDMPTKSTPTYTTIMRHNSAGKELSKYNNVIISPMNTVGLPSISGTQGVYSYPDDEVNTNPFEDSP